MKLIHGYSKFTFTDEEAAQGYEVVCTYAVVGNNVFKCYKGMQNIGSFTRKGGHVNKTTAKMVLEMAIAKLENSKIS